MNSEVLKCSEPKTRISLENLPSKLNCSNKNTKDNKINNCEIQFTAPLYFPFFKVTMKSYVFKLV